MKYSSSKFNWFLSFALVLAFFTCGPAVTAQETVEKQATEQQTETD